MKKILRRIFDGLLRRLYACTDNYFYILVIRPFLISLPSVAVACYKIRPVHDRLSPELLKALNDNALILAFIFIIVLPTYITLEALLKKRISKILPDLSQEGNALFFKALDKPVESKMNRFLSCMKDIKQNQPVADTIFKTITQPEKQLAEITRSIHIFFEGLAEIFEKKEIDFKTVLFKIAENKTPVENWCHFPEHCPPEAGILYDTKSLVFHTVQKKSIVIIEDIKKEKGSRKPRISQHCVAEDGSAICYPIRCIHTNTTPFAIRIVANGGFFETDREPLYQKVFQRFEKRVLLEYALGEIKNYVEA